MTVKVAVTLALTVAVTITVTVAVTVALTMTMAVAMTVAVAVAVAVTMWAKGYAQTDCHRVDESWEVPWLQEEENATHHRKNGNKCGKMEPTMAKWGR